MREAEIIELIRYVVSPILPAGRGCRAESRLVFHHFAWAEGTRFSGTESVQLWTTDSNLDAWDFRAEGMFAQGSFNTVQNELYFTP